MIPVDQTVFHAETTKGNCLRAAIASILEIDIESIPRFEEMGEQWFVEFRKWSRLHGHGEVQVYHHSVPPQGLSIVAGMSPRGIDHSCVALNGEIAHDPHPSRSGLVEIERYWQFTIINPYR
jgi:hypothetical protein